MYKKKDFPVSNIRRFLEPGPVVLVSSAWNGKNNIMTMGWHTVMEFSPSLIGCIISRRESQFRDDKKEQGMRDQHPDPRHGQKSCRHRKLLRILKSTSSKNSN